MFFIKNSEPTVASRFKNWQIPVQTNLEQPVNEKAKKKVIEIEEKNIKNLCLFSISKSIFFFIDSQLIFSETFFKIYTNLYIFFPKKT